MSTAKIGPDISQVTTRFIEQPYRELLKQYTVYKTAPQ